MYPIYEKQGASADLYNLHTHAHAELFACSEGSFTLQTESGLLAIAAGDIAIVPPGFPHSKLPCAKETRWQCLDFVCVGRRRTGCTDLQKTFHSLCYGDAVLIARGAEELCREIERIADHSKNECSVLPALRLAAVLTELSLQSLQRVGRTDAPVHTIAEDIVDINRLARLDYLLNGCFTNQDLTVSSAAKLLFISERQLERIMKKEYGKPFRRALCDKRLEAAEHMLLETDWSAERIAQAVGFQSKSAFCRAFAAKNALTPTEYKCKAHTVRG